MGDSVCGGAELAADTEAVLEGTLDGALEAALEGVLDAMPEGEGGEVSVVDGADVVAAEAAWGAGVLGEQASVERTTARASGVWCGCMSLSSIVSRPVPFKINPGVSRAAPSATATCWAQPRAKRPPRACLR